MDALGPLPARSFLHVLMLPAFDRADRIGEFYGAPGGAPRFLSMAGRTGNSRRSSRACWFQRAVRVGAAPALTTTDPALTETRHRSCALETVEDEDGC